MPQNRAKLHFNKEFSWQYMQLGCYRLAQIGDLKCEPGYLVEPHQQWVDEISFVVSGNATFEADGKAFEVSDGMIFLSGRHEVHGIRSSVLNPMRMLYLGFDFTEPCNERMAVLKAFFDRPLQRTVRATADIQQAFMRLMSEILRQDELSAMLMEGHMHEIICAIYRRCHASEADGYLMRDASCASDKLVHDVMLYLETRQEYTGKLKDLSAEFGYSYAHIAKEFSAITGESLKAYDTRLRFSKACEDMRCGLSVTETAGRMGYQSIHAFSRAFKNALGITASQFMRKLCENAAAQNELDGACQNDAP